MNVKNAIGVKLTPIARGMRAADATACRPFGRELPKVAVIAAEPLAEAGNVTDAERPAAIIAKVVLVGSAPTFRTWVAVAGVGVGVGAGLGVGEETTVGAGPGAKEEPPPPPPPPQPIRITLAKTGTTKRDNLKTMIAPFELP